ncbi:MAG TPA: fatty acid desaturase [Gemmataceae bacterium]|nr:fatty acid desaturase [Gemmataceae bacterium]
MGTHPSVMARTKRDPPTLTALGRDLISLTSCQRCRAVLLPFLSVAACVLFAANGWWLPAVLSVAAYTFSSYGSTSHDLVHGNLGLPHRLNDILLTLVELLGLRSGHAYRAAHLHHHARFPHPDDLEGAAAHGSWWAALLTAPAHQLRLWWWASRYAKHDRAWIVFEGIACGALFVSAILVWPWSPAPAVYVALVIAGSWTFPLITSYFPHDPKGEDEFAQTRRFRGKVFAVVFGQHLYHLEHHLYPRVPRQKWPELAKRLDPYLDAAGVKPVCFGF